MLTNKYIRRFFIDIVFIFIFSIFGAVILSNAIGHDFKSILLNHDYKLAGYMINNGAAIDDVSEIFSKGNSAENTEADLSSGKQLLSLLGYNSDTEDMLIDDVMNVLVKYKIMFIFSVSLVGSCIIISFYKYFNYEDKTIKKAINSINDFMDGNREISIDSDDEGSIYKLFASINNMATAMNSHVETQKGMKEFLQNTISDIFHQLKTPLAALEMYNEIIQDEPENVDTIKKFASKTENSLNRMKILIKNLLKITKLDAGTVELNKKEENIYLFLQDIISSFETRAEEEEKTLILTGPKDITAYWDDDWMIEAVSNIIKNSLDHTLKGGRINIELKETPVITRIIISDNGTGIHPEDIHNIFKRFYRSRYSQDTQGLGLGLSLAKAIIELHNGTITVDSVLGQGSAFTLDFLKITKL